MAMKRPCRRRESDNSRRNLSDYTYITKSGESLGRQPRTYGRDRNAQNTKDLILIHNQSPGLAVFIGEVPEREPVSSDIRHARRVR